MEADKEDNRNLLFRNHSCTRSVRKTESSVSYSWVCVTHSLVRKVNGMLFGVDGGDGKQDSGKEDVKHF